jgi:hypothetical protein
MMAIFPHFSCPLSAPDNKTSTHLENGMVIMLKEVEVKVGG